MSLGNVIQAVGATPTTPDYAFVNAGGNTSANLFGAITSVNTNVATTVSPVAGKLPLGSAALTTIGASGATINAADITIATAGIYHIHAVATMDPWGGNGTQGFQILNNGAILSYGTSGNTTNDTIFDPVSLVWIGNLAVGDILDFRVAISAFQVEVFGYAIEVVQIA